MLTAFNNNQPAIDVLTTAIHLESLSVRYRVPQEPYATFREYLIRLIQRQVRYTDFYALKDVGLEIARGEAFGLIGANGAGKSTLLKVIARVLSPTTGRVIVSGTVAPLLELGAGFHPELTGRENVFLNGALLGYSHDQMKAAMGWIIDFSGLSEFIDAPIRTYSSGMYARLGFSVATAYRPDILIVDEVLGVGDEEFFMKCTKRIEEFQQHHTTVLFVSHNLAMVESICQRAAWLDHGCLKMTGQPSEVIRAFRAGYKE